MSEEMGRDNGRRIYFLTFGSPPKGKNKGNTPMRTLKLLRLLDGAMKHVKYHQDGDWNYALQACAVHVSSACLFVCLHCLSSRVSNIVMVTHFTLF